MADAGKHGISVTGESRILQLRATLWEVRRLIQAGAEKQVILDQISKELKNREWSIVDD
jgi:hypothetical protein